MTSKLKCPFCGEELDPRFDAYHETITSWVCINEKCVSFDWEFPPKAWQVLIQAKQDLETAKADIEDYKKHKALWEQIRNNTILELERKLEITRKAADNSREKLAAFMHDTWGNWFAYQLKNSTVKNLQRWGIQSNTPYSSLTETDKDKDRKFADKIIEIIKEQITHDNSEKPNSHEHKE